MIDAQIEPFVDQLDPAQIDVEQLLRAQATRRHERLQLRDARVREVIMIAAERREVLGGCIVGLCVGGERCESRSPGSQRAGLQKRPTTEPRVRVRLAFLATPLRLFSVFHGLLPRDEERRLYSMRQGEKIRTV